MFLPYGGDKATVDCLVSFAVVLATPGNKLFRVFVIQTFIFNHPKQRKRLYSPVTQRAHMVVEVGDAISVK